LNPEPLNLGDNCISYVLSRPCTQVSPANL
jgi:hypothetical protein